MPQTKVVIIHDLATYEIRRIIVPDDDSRVEFHQPLPGEGRIVMTKGFHFDPAFGMKPSRSTIRDCAIALQQGTGRWPPNVSK
jgi:hypothetical protein